MGLPIISADQRLAERHGVKLVLLGFWGLGKTTQLKTLPEASTLFVDLEAGDLALAAGATDDSLLLATLGAGETLTAEVL